MQILREVEGPSVEEEGEREGTEEGVVLEQAPGL